MSAGLRFERECEGRVTTNVYALDGVHLDGDVQGHGES
jgi:hypothetical protein